MPPKLYLLDPALTGPDEIVFNSPCGLGRFMAGALFFMFSMLAFFAVEPRSTGRVLAFVLLGACVIEAALKGFKTAIIFHRDTKEVTLRRIFFNRCLSSGVFPYQNVLLAIRSFDRFHGAVGATPLLYTITIGARTYLLLFPPSYYPPSEQSLKYLKTQLGFDERAL